MKFILTTVDSNSVVVYCTALCVSCAESVSDLSDREEPVNDVGDVTTDAVYSNLASLLTALQSVRPAGHTLDSCVVNNISISCLSV